MGGQTQCVKQVWSNRNRHHDNKTTMRETLVLPAAECCPGYGACPSATWTDGERASNPQSNQS